MSQEDENKVIRHAIENGQHWTAVITDLATHLEKNDLVKCALNFETENEKTQKKYSVQIIFENIS